MPILQTGRDARDTSLLNVVDGEGTLAGPGMANMALAGLAFLPDSLCLDKNCWMTFLKLATKVQSLIWPRFSPTRVQLSEN